MEEGKFQRHMKRELKSEHKRRELSIGKDSNKTNSSNTNNSSEDYLSTSNTTTLEETQYHINPRYDYGQSLDDKNKDEMINSDTARTRNMSHLVHKTILDLPFSSVTVHSPVKLKWRPEKTPNTPIVTTATESISSAILNEKDTQKEFQLLRNTQSSKHRSSDIVTSK